MPFSVATWNINSVRLRMPIVERLLLERAPDVLCLQETKCPDDLFPFDRFHALGYRHVEIHGQKGYHGVATVSRRPVEVVERRQFCEIADSRHLSVCVRAGGRCGSLPDEAVFTHLAADLRRASARAVALGWIYGLAARLWPP